MKKTLRVLNVEDSERDVALLQRHLSRAGYQLIAERVDTPEAMRTALQTKEWDVILCDYSMPHFNALAAVALLQESGIDTPFIIISGTVGEDVAVQAMRAGANDYLMKDNLVRLVPTIEREMHEAENRRARRQAEEALKASEAELRALFAVMNDVILVLDAKGRYLKIAPTTPSRLFKPEIDRIGKTVYDLLPKQQAEFYLEHIRRALEEGRMQRIEYSLPMDGAEAWFEGSVSPLSKDTVLWIARDITDRKHAEEEKARLTAQIESQRRRLNTIIATVPGVVWEAWGEVDVETHQTEFVSDYIEKMLGYSVADWLSTPNFWLSIMHPDDQERVARELSAIYEKGGQASLEFRWVGKGGQVVWVISNLAVISDNKGRSVGLRGVTTDISERKRAEEAVQASERRYRLLFESNPLPMWVYDLESLAFLAVNDAAIRHYGYPRGEFLAMTIKEIRPREDVAAFLGHVWGEESDKGEADKWRHRKKNGQVIDVEITSSELRFEGRRARLVLANDVTERRQLEEAQARRTAHAALRADISTALAASDAPLPTILNRCTEAIVRHLDAAFARIWTLNKDQGMLELQASAGRYSDPDGPNARVPVGHFEIGRIAADRQPCVTNDVQSDPFISGNDWASQEAIVAFAGYPLLVEDRLVGVVALFARQPLSPDTLEALAAAADIISQGIERRRAEEALRQSEEQLRQAQKLEAIGQLAGGVAHDFNNLLTVISGFTQLSMRGLREEDPLRRNLEEVRKASERASALTRQLLAFSRKQVLQPQLLDINLLVGDLEKMLGRLIGEDIELRTVLGAESATVKADPGQLEQVVMNLVVNARDAMPEGGKLVIETSNLYLDEEYVAHHISVRPGEYVLLAISDTGEGMDSETQKHIFEPFFTTKGVGKGTGLGLSTVYGIVKQSGGNIWVYSEAGQGTTFKIYLPRTGEEAAWLRPSWRLAETLQGTETILLAEDEEMVRQLTREVLESYGYRVLEAANGKAALRVCEGHEGAIELLITDVIMPEMSGRELASRLARMRPEMQVLFMSGYTDSAIEHQGILEAGIQFIQKPFTPEELARKVREVLISQRKP